MAKDAKLTEIELKQTDFNTERQEWAADILLEEWEDGPKNFNDLEEAYDYTGFQKVMNQYMGPPDHDLTVEEIRARFGSVHDYLEERKADNVDLDTQSVTESELEMWKEGYRDGYQDGLEEGIEIDS